jgi:hypothetical protein
MTLVEDYIIYVSDKIVDITKEPIDVIIHKYYKDDVDEFLDNFLKTELLHNSWYVRWKNINMIKYNDLMLLTSRVSNDELIQILNIKLSYNLKIVRFCKSVLTKIELQIILFTIIILLYYYICYKIDIFIKSMVTSAQI